MKPPARGGRRPRVGVLACAAVAVLCGFAGEAVASAVDQLLGLRALTWSDPDATLGWEHPLPAWAWALVAIGAAGLAGWSYSRLLGSRPVRLVLAGLRALVILSVAVLLAGPTLIDPREHEEPDALIVLVDRSGSLQIADAIDPGTGEPVARDEALRRALLAQAGVFGGEGLGASAERARRVTWLGFGERVYELPPLTEPAVWERPEVQAEGSATALRTALEQAVRSAAGRPIAGIVLFSDGRTAEATGVELVRQLTGKGARVHVVPLGSPDPPLDWSITQVDAPREAFADDVVPITVRVDATGGGEGGADASSVRVRLVDAATGAVLDEQSGDAAAAGEFELSARSETPGPTTYRVEVVDEGGRPELVTQNNVREVEVQIIDRPIRVLYVEGYPRWEYRYLKNTLIREASIDSSMLLLSADRAFAQEGDSPITRPPNTLEEMRRYDVVILGDAPPGYFTPQQLTLLRDHVVNGGGLLWIGGPVQTPGAWSGTPLEDVLPMRSPSGSGPLPVGGGVRLTPTPLAERLNVLRLRGPDGEVVDEIWARELPPLQWAQDAGELKPAAEVLAVGVRGSESGASSSELRVPNAEPGTRNPELDTPLLIRLRYGAGQSLYLATDETWRWRYGRGELYHEQFWVQLVRMLGRDRVQQSGDRARFAVSHRRVGVDEPVVLELVIDDPALAERDLPQIAVTARTVTAGGQELAVDQVELRPVAEPLEPGAGGARRTYRAVWRPSVAGTITLRVTEPALDELALAEPIDVAAADDELRHVEPDHARLEALAEATGGEVVPLDELDRLVPAVPELAEKVATDAREPLWRSTLSFAVVLLLLSLEWIGRKAIWLV